MSDEELKQLWQEGGRAKGAAEISLQIKDALGKFDRDIRKRDWQEIIIAAILVPVFATIAWRIEPALSQIGAILTIPALLFIVFKLRQVKSYRPAYDALPVREYLIRYRAYMYQQMMLLDHALYWYILPCAIPILLFFIGRERYLLAVLTIPLYVWVYQLNKKAARDEMKPLIDKLDEQLHNMENI